MVTYALSRKVETILSKLNEELQKFNLEIQPPHNFQLSTRRDSICQRQKIVRYYLKTKEKQKKGKPTQCEFTTESILTYKGRLYVQKDSEIAKNLWSKLGMVIGLAGLSRSWLCSKKARACPSLGSGESSRSSAEPHFRVLGKAQASLCGSLTRAHKPIYIYY